jgi:predicted 2-oxoglutarate/Fe(II)-dependent dioxygenase YbiX
LKGELAPQFGVRDANGHSDNLRAALEGNPHIILYLPRPGRPAGREVAQAFAALQCPIPRVRRTVLVPATTPGAEVIALSDLGLSVLVAHREGDTPSESIDPIMAITDNASRILDTDRLPAGKVPDLAARAQRALAPPGETSDTAQTHAAPVLIIPNVLTPTLCKRLIAHFERSENHPSGVMDLSGKEPQWRPDPEVKSRRDLYIEDSALTREIEQAMATRVLPEIRKCFQYVVTHHEPFKLVRYDAGEGYFRPHRDNESADSNYRRFAMTLNLNTGEYDGGALNFPEFGNATYRPPLGGAIVFSCSLLHEATDVTRGSRHVLLGFFYNPADGLTPPSGKK